MTVRFQMLNTFKRKLNPQGGLLLADALNRGIGLDAHFIEVYAVNCKDPPATRRSLHKQPTN